MSRSCRSLVARLFVAGSVVAVVAACGGGASGTSNAAATVNLAKFCQDYLAADNAYQQTSGDVSDPSFDQFLTALTKAQAEAPSAVKADLTGMLNAVRKVKAESSTAQSVSTDLSAASSRVSSWAEANCGGGGNTGSPTG